jgi:outer membrane protein OmpA-like peptidoglycan-associated protein
VSTTWRWRPARERRQKLLDQPRHRAGPLARVSKGEEAPFCTTDGEDCWQQNRRGHFIITAK